MADEEQDFFTVDPDEAFETLPEGDYDVIVTEVVKKRKEGSEFPYVELTMAVADGQYEGWEVVDRLTENPTARWRLARVVKAAGLAREGGEQQFRCSDLKGSVFTVKVEHEDFKGMKMARPARYSMHPNTAERIKAEESAGESAEGQQAEAVKASGGEASKSAPKKTLPPKRPPSKPPGKTVKV